jgi:uncharacterized membrane protein HdeD (DUF308 family)
MSASVGLWLVGICMLCIAAALAVQAIRVRRLMLSDPRWFVELGTLLLFLSGVYRWRPSHSGAIVLSVVGVVLIVYGSVQWLRRRSSSARDSRAA